MQRVLGAGSAITVDVRGRRSGQVRSEAGRVAVCTCGSQRRSWIDELCKQLKKRMRCVEPSRIHRSIHRAPRAARLIPGIRRSGFTHRSGSQLPLHRTRATPTARTRAVLACAIVHNLSHMHVHASAHSAPLQSSVSTSLQARMIQSRCIALTTRPLRIFKMRLLSLPSSPRRPSKTPQRLLLFYVSTH